MQDEGDDGWGESWETVPSKECSMPQRGRKHALPLSQGSPGKPLQLPKAPREAPPSPAASPMQAYESSGLILRSAALYPEPPACFCCAVSHSECLSFLQFFCLLNLVQLYTAAPFWMSCI